MIVRERQTDGDDDKHAADADTDAESHGGKTCNQKDCSSSRKRAIRNGSQALDGTRVLRFFFVLSFAH